jgi:hypothetical protein
LSRVAAVDGRASRSVGNNTRISVIRISIRVPVMFSYTHAPSLGQSRTEAGFSVLAQSVIESLKEFSVNIRQTIIRLLSGIACFVARFDRRG